MREIVHLQAGQCGNQIGAKVRLALLATFTKEIIETKIKKMIYVALEFLLRYISFINFCFISFLFKKKSI